MCDELSVCEACGVSTSHIVAVDSGYVCLALCPSCAVEVWDQDFEASDDLPEEAA